MSEPIHIDVFGRRIIADYQSGKWQLSLAGIEGKSRPLSDILVPEEITTEEDLLRFLFDIYHESARPGHNQVCRIPNG